MPSTEVTCHPVCLLSFSKVLPFTGSPCCQPVQCSVNPALRVCVPEGKAKQGAVPPRAARRVNAACCGSMRPSVPSCDQPSRAMSPRYRLLRLRPPAQVWPPPGAPPPSPARATSPQHGSGHPPEGPGHPPGASRSPPPGGSPTRRALSLSPRSTRFASRACAHCWRRS